MVTTYKLDTRELKSAFDSIRKTYPNRVVEIEVREQDTTEYLLRSPANRERLLKAIENIEKGENLISFASVEDLMKTAEEYRKNND